MISTEKYNVLVFPCGSEIGLEINRALSKSLHVNLFGGSSTPDHGEYVYQNYIGNIPFIDSPYFIREINRVIDEYKIDIIFPAHDSVVLELAKHRGSINCKVVVPPYETCEICRSKEKTYKYFEKLLNTPCVYSTSTLIENYPVFLKPNVGQGSKGTHTAFDKNDVDFYLAKDSSLLILEYLPGREFTIDCFTDNKGELLFVGGRERARIQSGISVNTYPVLDQRFVTWANIINENIEMTGPWFFQVKERTNGDLVLMEIATRIAGTMGMTRYQGVNMPLLAVFNAYQKEIKIFTNSYDLMVDRALISRSKLKIEYKHVYIDLDDTLIFDNKVNTSIVTFLFQCINNDISLHLITKHQGNVKEYLSKFRMESIFDSIICVSKDDEKYKYITNLNSIFIDDSFAERQIVSKKLGIPTFDVTMAESLLDWRS